MAIRQLPDPNLLRKVLRYDPSTGDMIWLARPIEMFTHCGKRAAIQCRLWNAKFAGKPAFYCIHISGYKSGGIFGQLHLAHRVAWALHYGVSDFGMIDHIDGDRTNNRISNLRLASCEINTQNAHRRHDCTSGVTGVHWHVDKRWGRPCWTARIQCGKQRIFLGSFDNLEDAIKARRAAEAKYGFGPTHGKAAK